MIVDKINLSGEIVGKYEVADALSTAECNPSLVHACVLAHLANKRQGTHSTLTKGEVNRTGKKPFRQKGTGRARAGYFSSPVWRGGGIAFGPKPRDYSQKVNKRVKRSALIGILADKLREEKVLVIESWEMEAPKTKTIATLKTKLNARKMLCVGFGNQENAFLSARNIENVKFMDVTGLNVYDVTNSTLIIMAETAIKAFEAKIDFAVAVKETE